MPKPHKFLIALILSGAGFAAAKAGQIAYHYDAQGRLVRVTQSGGISGYDAQYQYDKADNRTQRTVTGARAGLVVVPHGGQYRVIPIPAQ